MLQHEHPEAPLVDSLAVIERLASEPAIQHIAREAIDDAVRRCSSSNEQLMGLEAKARSLFEETYARGFDLHLAMSFMEFTDGMTLFVLYRPFDGFAYRYATQRDGLAGVVPSRDLALHAIEQRVGL